MNPLSEHGHLFANGEFRATATFKDDEIPKEDWFIEQGLITGYDPIADNICISDEGWCKVWYAKLIARPIESMSDEELFEWLDSYDERQAEEYKKFGIGAEDVRDQVINGSKRDTMSRDQALYLLEIGVFPFDQSHFGDTVIDTRTLKTNEVS